MIELDSQIFKVMDESHLVVSPQTDFSADDSPCIAHLSLLTNEVRIVYVFFGAAKVDDGFE